MNKVGGRPGSRGQVTAELEKIDWALEELGKLPTKAARAAPPSAAHAIGESYKLTQAAEEHGLDYKPQRSHLTKNKILTVLALLALLALPGWRSCLVGKWGARIGAHPLLTDCLWPKLAVGLEPNA